MSKSSTAPKAPAKPKAVAKSPKAPAEPALAPTSPDSGVVIEPPAIEISVEPKAVVEATEAAPAQEVVVSAEPATVAELPAPAPTADLEDILPELHIDADGKATIRMLVALSGTDIDVVPRKAHRCSPQEATRFIRKELAEQPAEWLATQPRA
jgi:hypothetical protein